VCLKGQRDDASQYDRIVKQAIRCPDPFLDLRKGWIVRRLAPDCSRVELTMLPKGHDEYKLLEAMGRETANVHLGSKRAIGPKNPGRDVYAMVRNGKECKNPWTQ